MRLMICANLDVGGLPAIDVPPSDMAQWQQDKIKALSGALDDASNRGADACIVAGGLFARGFVAQSLLEGAMHTIGGRGMRTYYAPLPGEAKDLGERVELDGGATIVSLDSSGTTKLDVVVGEEVQRVVFLDCHDLGSTEDEARRVSGPMIVRDGRDIALCAKGEVASPIGPLEPSEFGDPLPSGYLLVDVDGDGIASSAWIETAVHPFVTRKVVLDGMESSRDLVTTVGKAVKDVDRSACLRIVLRGRIPLDVYINADELASQIGRYFHYVEVADECALDIDVESMGADVSLLAEFVRQVSGDDSLSETEKVRILRCGWNALNGKELVE